MSCNGCRVLRKGCSETCVLRQCLRLIENPDAQGHATLFVAKFFGRAGLMSFISAVPESQRPALFQSLLFEACGRTINPVNGAVGLLWTGNWHLCQAAVETVLRGGALRPLSLDAEPEADAAYEAGPGLYASPARRFSSSSSQQQQQQSPVTKRRRASPATHDDVEGGAAGTSRLEPSDLDLCLTSAGLTDRRRLKRPGTPSEESVTTSCAESGVRTTAAACHLQEPQQQPMLLNLFA